MTNASAHTGELRLAVATEKSALLDSYVLGTPTDRVHDVLRAIDHTFAGLRVRARFAPGDGELSAVEGRRFKAASVALGMVVSAVGSEPSQATPGSTDERERWAAAFLDSVADLATVETYLSLVETRVATLIREGEYAFRVEIPRDAVGYEALERAYVDDQPPPGGSVPTEAEARAHETIRLHHLRTRRPKTPSVLVDSPSRALDTAYYDVTSAVLRRSLGSDTYDGGATFGGVTFEAYRQVVAAVMAVAWQHLNTCLQTAPARVSEWCAPKVDLWVLTRRLSRMTGLTTAVVRDALSGCLLTAEGVGDHYRSPDAALPSLHELGPDQYVLSLSGATMTPMTFTLGELSRRYSKDYDRESKKREGVWRRELYELVTKAEPGRFFTVPTGLTLRSDGGMVTDFDAVILDLSTGVLGVFELKWQDLFVRDMVKRRSRMSRFVKETSDWVESAHTWLENQSTEQLCAHLKIKKKYATQIKRCDLFVLGRYSAHFSGQEPHDARAAWGTWAQVRTLHAEADPTEFARDPLTWLDRTLREDSPVGFERERVGSESYTVGRFHLAV